MADKSLNKACESVAVEIGELLSDSYGFNIHHIKPDPRGGWCISFNRQLPEGNLEIDMHLLPMGVSTTR